MRTTCPADKLLAAKDADIIRTRTSRFFSAKDARCHKCSKQAHFSKCCRAKSRLNMVNEVELAETSSSDSEVFRGKVSYMDFANMS